MFKLFRHFSIWSLIPIILVAVFLNLFYHRAAVRDLIGLSETQNRSVAQVLRNSLAQELALFIDVDAALPLERLKQRPERQQFHQQLSAHLRGSPIAKVKIYDRNALTTFSSDAEQIGEYQVDNPAVRAALSGEVMGELVYRETMSTFDGVVERRDLYESYIPIRALQGNEVLGVFEIYADVTPLLQRIRDTQVQIFLGVILMLGLLYLSLAWIVRRADGVISTNQEDLRASLRALKRAHAEAEQRVRDRTQDLQESHDRLTQEIETRSFYAQELLKLGSAVEQAASGIVITDTEGSIEYTNPRLRAMCGYSEAELRGENPRLLKSGLTPDSEYEALWATALAGEVWVGEMQNRHKDGSLFWVRLTVSPIEDDAGTTTHLLGVHEDISARRAAEEERIMAAKVYENTAEGILVTSPQGEIVSVNPAFCRVTGYDEAEVIGQNSSILSSGLQDAAFYRQMWHQLTEQGQWQGEIWNRRKNGEFYQEWLNISAIRNEQGEVVNFIGIFSDITKMKQTEEQLDYLANYDGLTGLPNRVLLDDRLQQAVHHAHRMGNQFAVVQLDLDRFKNINDTLGHKTGDLLLKAVAERLTQAVHEDDTVARQAGDEFLLILETVDDVDEIALACRDVLERLAHPFLLDGHELFVTASVGVAVYPDDGTDAETLLKSVDSAMYHAIEMGGDRYQFFTNDMNAKALQWLSMENDLRRALERDEFELHYQPQIELESGRMIGVEALVRWRHPELGFISPAEFIPLAEETGMIVPLGIWVLREACAQGVAWHDQGLAPLRMGVNLSAKQFEAGDLPDIVASVLKETGLSAERLELELTESILMQDAERTVAMLERLHAMWVNLSVDDFGTGYSSLSYLKQFRLHTLKIDQSFVRGIPDDNDDVEIVRAIVAMAQNLNLRTIAEGVTQRAQLNFLRKLGCDEIQGAYFGRPVAPAEIEARLRGSLA